VQPVELSLPVSLPVSLRFHAGGMVAGGKIPPGAECEVPFAELRAAGPAQRDCHGAAKGLCLSAVLGSAWLCDPRLGSTTWAHACFCSRTVLIRVKC